jgi:hypothetical protein
LFCYNVFCKFASVNISPVGFILGALGMQLTTFMLQIFGISLLNKSQIGELFNNTDKNDIKELLSEQLNLNLF